MTFDYSKFKAGFKKAALAKGIDPERGATEYQTVLVRAEMRRDQHYSHLRQQVQAAAERQQAQQYRGVEGTGFYRYDEAQRRIVFDPSLVDKAMSRYWWRALPVNAWRAGAGSPLIERQALAGIRREIAAALNVELLTPADIRQEEIEVTREVLEEVHAQQEIERV